MSGDVVILDNVAFYKNEPAAELIRQRCSWLLPPIRPASPASKFKALLRKNAAQSFDLSAMLSRISAT